MNIRQIVQRFSAGLVLGGEAVGALVLHESHSLAVTAPIVIVVILLTVWLLEAGLDRAVKRWDWTANLLGVKPQSKVKIHGYWYSAIRDHHGKLLGGSVFRIQAGIDEIQLTGAYKDLTVTPNAWTWWSGVGSPFGKDDILYGYTGVEAGTDDEGFGRYSFPSGESPQIIRGSFYGKNLPKSERFRTADGERAPKSDVTPEFKEKAEVRQQGLERFLARQSGTN
jgi:hypothetical protein